MTNKIDASVLQNPINLDNISFSQTKTLNIDTDNYDGIFEVTSTQISGTKPPNVSNVFLLIGHNAQGYYGYNIAIGFTNNTIAIRNKTWGGSWTQWRTI